MTNTACHGKAIFKRKNALTLRRKSNTILVDLLEQNSKVAVMTSSARQYHLVHEIIIHTSFPIRDDDVLFLFSLSSDALTHAYPPLQHTAMIVPPLP